MQSLKKRILNNPQLIPLIIVTVISTVMIILPLDVRTTVSRIGTLSLLYPFSELDNYFDKVANTFKMNRELNRKVDSLTITLSQFVESKAENDRLRRMLAFEPYPFLRMVPAEVVSVTFGYPFKSMVINVGSEAGIGSNMPVVSPDGIVGKTLAAGYRSTTVQLLFDPGCKVAARIQASRAQGLITYNGGNFLTLKDVPIEETAYAGDSVVTSGMGGIFPEGLFIGTVVRSGEQEGGLFHDIKVAPGADFSALDEVFVIINPTTVR